MSRDTKADFESRAASFPCLFFKDPLRGKERIRAIEINLEHEFETENDTAEQTIVKLNFSTWIEFKLRDYAEAKKINEKTLALSERKNITSLVCQAHILWHDGDERQAGECLNEAEHLRNGINGEMAMSKVEAELAYCYSRLGGPANLARAMDVYEKVIARHPEVYVWKFGLGLAHRRAMRGNLTWAMSPKRRVEEHAKIAAELFYDVAERSPDNRLKGRAFSQLAVMWDHARSGLNQSDFKGIFGRDYLKLLIDKALDCCSDDPLTLNECGRVLRLKDLENGTRLLERALDIKKHSTTYHQLGTCYEQMAKNKAKESVTMMPYCGENKDATQGETRGRSFDCTPNKRRQGRLSYHEVSPSRFHDAKPSDQHVRNLSREKPFGQKNVANTSPFPTYKTHDQVRSQKQMAIKNTSDRGQWGMSYQKQKKGKELPFVQGPSKEIPLKIDNDLVAKALACYKEAVTLSREGNISALHSFGILLRTCGEFDHALKQFNKIIHQTMGSSTATESNENIVTLTSAYEQAGLCLLDLAKQPGTTEEQIQKLNEDAETKLMKAVNLAATLANLDPEMKRYKKKVWQVFRTVETMNKEIKDSPRVIKMYIQTLMRICQYDRVPRAIVKLRLLSDYELEDPSVFQSAIESYLKLGRYEDAYNFVSSAPSAVASTDPLKALVLKVQLHMMAARLMSREFTAAQLILKSLFGSRFDRGGTHPTAWENKAERDKDKPDPPGEAKEILDVLIVYDINNVDTGSDFWEKVNTLQMILSGEFGLAVDTIEERLDAGKLELSQHVKEINTARTVLVLLRGESCAMSSLFTTVLKYIPVITMDCQTYGQPEPHIVLGLADDGVKVDQMLMRFMQIDVVDLLGRINVTADEDVPGQLEDPTQDQAVTRCLGDLQIRHEEVNDSHTDPIRGPAMWASPVNTRGVRDCPVSPSSGQEFDDGVTAKMSLLCALIKTQWPV